MTIVEKFQLTHEQSGIWFEWLRNPTSTAYTVQWAYRIEGKLDLIKFDASLRTVIQRHASLRTRIIEDSGKPYAIVHSDSCESSGPHLKIEIGYDEQSVRKILDRECNYCFDLYSEPLYRFTLIISGANQYYFCISAHHIIWDGTSSIIFGKHLSDIYTGAHSNLLNGNTVVPSISDWFTHEESHSQQEIEQSTKFWNNYMLGSSPVDLPTGSSLNQAYEGSNILKRILPEDFNRQLRNFNKIHSSSDFRTLLVAFQILLHLYTHSDDITIMYPKNVRPKHLHELMGHFVGLQPSRVHFNQNTTFKHVLHQVNDTLEQSKRYLPFNSSMMRSTDANILFGRSMYILDDILNLGDDVQVFRVPLDIMGSIVSHETLTLKMEPVQNRIELSFEFNRNKLQRAFVEQMADHYLNLLKTMINNIECPVHSVSYMHETEVHQLVHDWNDTVTVLPTQNVLQLFEQNVAEFPDHIAVRYLDSIMTYRELNSKANMLACHLKNLGVTFETPVVVSLQRSPEIIVAFIAVLKVGGAYVPIDPDYPQTRIDFIVGNSNAPVIITHSQYDFMFIDHDLQLVFVDRSESYSCYPSGNLGIYVSKTSLMKIIYTSGSTGKPKGVMVEHRGVVRLVKNTNCFTVAPEHNVAQICNCAFDASSLEIYMALLNAATLVIIPTSTVLDAREFSAAMLKYSISHIVFSTGVFDHLITMDSSVLNGLDTVIVGGDRMKPAISNKVLSDNALRPKHLLNVYGPTENSTSTTFYEVEPTRLDFTIPIGKSISNTQCYILDRYKRLVPIGVPGFLHTGGEGVARGYLNNHELTKERFFSHTFEDGTVTRLYNTGDLARQLSDGNIEFLGRNDKQIKLRGYRIELSEIEAEILKFPGVSEALVEPVEQGTNKKLVAFVKSSISLKNELHTALMQVLPAFMIPSEIVVLSEFPLNSNGKIDIPQMIQMLEKDEQSTYVAPRSELETDIANIWREVLQIERVGVNENFFDIGGNSLLLVQMRVKLSDLIQKDVALIDLYKYTTIEMLVQFLSPHMPSHLLEPGTQQSHTTLPQQPDTNSDIAIIGIAGRFPGAINVETFWNNICNGKGSVLLRDKQELKGEVDAELLNHPHYIPSRPTLDNIKGFDAHFFNMSPKEAIMTDPQHRVFLECIWEGLENAGYTPACYMGRIGLYAGAGLNFYSPASHLNSDLGPAEQYQSTIQNELDFLCSKIAYKLNFKGPAVTVQTACSTSLVAIHMACNSLHLGDCDMAIAGGVSLGSLDAKGYIYEDGMIYSKDGLVRPFDQNACGVVTGQGASVVILKPLQRALNDRDHIYAVIKGSAINNDGSAKVGYTAPSIDGLSNAIIQAHNRANIDPSTVTLIETHGTATSLGDQIEFAALKQVFSNCKERQFCALSSTKSAVGHLDTASGAAGLITATLALKYKTLPPIINFTLPHPKFNIHNSPFYVNTSSTAWDRIDPSIPRRAGVNSMGIGGTNAHVVLQESDNCYTGTAHRQWQLLSLSAKTPTALEKTISNMVQYLKKNMDQNLANIAYTLHVGRENFSHRQFVVCNQIENAVQELEKLSSNTVAHSNKKPAIVFMFPGSSSQYVNMAKNLYDSEQVFFEEMNKCLAILNQLSNGHDEELCFSDLFGTDLVNQTEWMQPLIFSVEYCLAKLVLSWNVVPTAMIGHSLGEYTAACLAGVFSLEHALSIVVARGKLAQSVSTGRMLAVNLSEEEISPYLGKEVSLAAVNSHSQCVISGSEPQIVQICQDLKNRPEPVQCKLLNTTIAFHSHMFDPVLDQFVRLFDDIVLNTPTVPIISCTSGTWMKQEEATSPHYWASHLRQTVQFSKGISTLLTNPSYRSTLLLEVGPSRTLSALARNFITNNDQIVIPLMRRQIDQEDDVKCLMSAIGKIWISNGTIDWNRFYEQEERCRLPLPTYPFERVTYWKGLPQLKIASSSTSTSTNSIEDGSAHMVDYEKEKENGYSNNLEKIIISQWEQVLGVHGLNSSSDFFDVGGDSLLAISMLARLGKILDMNIHPSTLIEYRTVAQLATAIEERSNVPKSNSIQTSSLVKIQSGKSGRTPMILIHAIGGEIYEYIGLSKALGNDQPLYAFKSPCLENSTVPPESIHEIAKSYVQELLQAIPNGPFIIGGHSFGGIVALEMAQQLKKLNQQVPLLIAMDSPILDSVPDALDKDGVIEYMRKHHDKTNLSENLIKTWLSHQEAMSSYRPEPYDGQVVFLDAEQQLDHFIVRPVVSWYNLTTDMHVHPIPDNHARMIWNPRSVEMIASVLQQYL